MEKDKGLFSFRKHPVGDFPDGEKGRKRKGGRLRQSMGFLMAAALVFNTLPASGLAVSASGRETGLCEHHRSHTADCGYMEAQPCTHEHTEECYTTVTECVHTHTDGCYPETEETEESAGERNATASDAEDREPENCTHQCSEESGCITKVLDCHHEHDESCGYNEAQECSYVCEICNGAESEDTENTEDAGTDMAECICEILCTEDSINGDCPVCGAEGADLSACEGKEQGSVPEIDTGEKTEEQEKTGEKVITAWEWIDPEEYLTDGMLALPGAGRENPAFAEDVTALLPEKIQAEVVIVNAAEDGEETEEDAEAAPETEGAEITLTGWECASYQEDGAYEGTYTFTASLPGGFVLAEDAAALKVEVELGGAKVLAETVSASYQEASWNDGVTYTTKTADSCTPVTDSTTEWTDGGWYVVNNTVTISEPITVSGDVSLILTDGCTLTAAKGIVVTDGNSLTIYAQSENGGTLNATGTTDDSGNASAGIGGGTSSLASGSITIHGGVINAAGGYGKNMGGSGAGIGGGGSGSIDGDGGDSGAITIFDGVITAVGGELDYDKQIAAYHSGAGIGGSSRNNSGGAGNLITIYGGTVTAKSQAYHNSGAGIGGGAANKKGGAGNSIAIYGGNITATSDRGDGIGGAGIGGGGGNESGDGTITISGGIVTAVGDNYAAGIGGGGGYQYSNQWASDSITGGTGSVTITGGIVDASSPTDVDWEGYEGAPIGNGGNATATATVNKTTGIIFENGVGTVCGDVTLAGSYTVPAGYSLHIPAGASLSGSGTLSGGETFTTDLSEDMISVPEDLYYDGTDRTAELQNDLSAELNKGIEICGQTFTVSGWTLAVAKAADSDLTYTATYTNNNDNTNTFTKTITLQKSGTDLTSEGKVQTYKGDTLTKDFTASDTITVKATPTATGQAPAKAAARLRGDPTAGQMVVFVGDTQVSAPADKGADGAYTMTVSAADVLAAAGGPGTGITLTAKFVGNDNMADGAGTVDVSISAVAKIENGSTTTYVGNLDDAFKTENDGATITLLKDVTRTPVLDIQITCNLDLGGHTITCTGGTAIGIWSNANLTIQGAGEVISTNKQAIVVAGNVTLEGGTFTSKQLYSEGVYINSANASLSVVNENVTIRNTGGGCGLAVNNAQSVQLSGGTYSGTAGAISIVGGSLTLGGLLAHSGDTRYAYFDESGTTPFTGVLGNKSLTGTVTVKKCNHTGEGVCEYTPNEGAETHAMTCLACGYAGAAESCAYSDDYGHDETNHWQTCTLCGGKKTEAHGWVHQCTSATGIIRRSCDKCEIETVVGTVSITPDFSVTYGKTGSATLVCTAELADGYSLEPADSADNCWVLMALSDGKSWNLGRELEVKLPADLPAGEYWYDAYPRLSYQGNNTIVKRFNVIGKVTVTPAPLTVTGAAAKDRTYDGTNSVQITGVTLDGVLNSDNVSVDLTGLTGTLSGSDAETYTSVTLPRLTLTGGAASNYTLPQSMGAVPASVTISKATLTATGATVASKTYDGNTAASVSSVTFTGLVPGEALALGTDYTATGTFADASAGANKRATIVVELKSSAKANNYTLPKDSSVNAIGTITAIPIADKNVTLSPASAVYDGTEQKPTVTIAGLTEGTDYTVSYIGDFTKAGEHTVTVTGKGNYTGTVTKEYAISKADVPAGNLAYTPPADLLYTGQPKTAAVTVNNLTGIGTVTVKYKKDNSGDLLAEAKEPGTYHVYADISVGQNYNATQIEMDSFTISYMDSPAVILYNGEAAKGWYNGDVVITADGYTVSDTLGEEYKDSYTISAQEGTVAKTLYFKDAAGHMSGGVEVTVKFDLTPPTGEIAVGAKWWQNVLHFISFGNYAAKEYTVTIKAEDKKGSGISKIEYAIVTGGSQYTDADTLKAANLSWKEYNSGSRPTVPVSNSQYVVYARLTDNVGNVTYISTDGILLDNTPPTVGSLSVPEDTRKDVTAGFTFTVSEAADYYYVVLPKDSAAPDPEDIIVTCGGTLPEGTGTAISGTFPKGSGAVSADTLPASVSVEAENLSPNTAYTVYVTAVDRAVDITDSAEGTPAGNIAAVQNVDFTTKKTLPVITKAPAVAGTYGQSVGEMTVTGGTAQAGSTVLVGTWTVSDADKNEKPSAGTSEVTVIFKPDNANYDSVSVQASLTVSQRNLNAEGVTVSEVAGTYTYTGSEIRPPVAVGTGTPAAGIYISDSGAALTASDFTVSYSNHKDAGTASVTITGKGNYTGSVTRTFTIGKAPGREVPDVSGSYTDNGQTYTYTVTSTEGAVYRMGNDGKWQEENVFEGITPGTSVTFYAKMPETGNYEDGTPKSITVDFPKLTPAAPALSYKADRTNPADVKVTITPVSGAEYSFDGGKTWTESNEQGGFTTSDTVTLAIRLKETDTHNQSPVQTVTVNLAKKDREAPPAFSLKVEANGETDYTVTIPATEGCEYSFDGEHWSDVNVKTGVSVGETVTGYKRYKETNDYNASSAVSAKETMPKFTVKTPVISPAGGSYEGNVSVTITCASPDAEIYYTTDGSAPGCGSTRYTGAFTVTAPATVKAIAVKEGLTDSAEASVTYTKKSDSGSGSGGNGGGNSGGNEDNGGQGSGGGGSTNPGNGSTTPPIPVIPPAENINPGNGATPGTGTTPVNPGTENTVRPGSGAGTPVQGAKQPFIKGEDGKIGWDVIRAEEEKAQEGSTINVDMNGSTVVPGDIFDSIKGKDIIITFDMGNGILWSVDGKSITTDKAGDIDFSVKSGVKTVPVDIVNNVTGESYSIQISLAYEGEFGFTAVLSIGLGKENAGYTASLYYYNESTGELEFICSDEVAQDGTVSLAFTHASDYVIAIDGDGEKESGNVTEPAQPDTPEKDSTESAGENPQNGQAWRPWWFIVVGSLVIVMGIGIFFAVRKKQETENS